MITWTRHHDKLWLSYELGPTTYEIPFDEQTRFINGFVLSFNTKHPQLVKNMRDSTSHMAELEKFARHERGAVQREVLTAVEEYQWDQLLAAGVTPDYAKAKREPIVTEYS